MNDWKITFTQLARFEAHGLIKFKTKRGGWGVKLSFLTECDADGNLYDDNWHRGVTVYDTAESREYDLRKVRGKAQYTLKLRSE